MSDLVPVSVPVPHTEDDDPRIGHLIGKGCTAENAKVVIVGFPTDKGVRRNGGRLGAAEGPAAIRQAPLQTHARRGTARRVRRTAAIARWISAT